MVDDQYDTFSSIFFYANRGALLLNGRVNNLEYGSYAPGAPRDIFIDDDAFRKRWNSGAQYYLAAEGPQMPRFERLVGKTNLHTVPRAAENLWAPIVRNLFLSFQ